MLERDLCLIIGHSLDWYHKVSDYGGVRHGVLPFDLFGVLNNKPIYIEAKFSKKPESFNLQRIQPHQLENLMEVKRLCPIAQCWVVLGVNFSRGDTRVYVFDDLDNLKKRRDSKDNILKKELLSLPYYPIKKGKIVWELVTPEK